MLTPRFTLDQNDDFVLLVVHAPHIRASEVEFYVEASTFKFYCKPYFLRLTLPGRVVEDGRETCTYDVDAGDFAIALPKETAGEVFEGLDMITRLLAKPPAAREAGAPLIEVVGGDEDAEAEIDWEAEQRPWDEGERELRGLGSAAGYGFNRRHSSVVGRALSEDPEAVECADPERMGPAEREAARVAAEDARFNPARYAGEVADEEGEVAALVAAVPVWQRRGEAWTEEERERLQRLPRVELMVDAPKRELLGLVDMLFGWAYDCRITEGEHTVESGWTISRLSATLSHLVEHRGLKEAAVACMRRALAYPLLRHWDLAAAVLADVAELLRLGRRAVLRCLLDMQSVFERDESRHVLNAIYITDYCVWVQSVEDGVFVRLGESLAGLEMERASTGWPLAAIEEIMAEEDGSEESKESEESEESEEEEGVPLVVELD